MKSKISIPALPPAILHREGLIARLHNIIAISHPASKESQPQYKLVLLCAPAGYGKTTLLTDFAVHTDIPCCWYFLDHSDTDRFTFLSNLLASIRYCFPGFGTQLDPLLTDDSIAMSYTDDTQRFQTFVDALVTALEREMTERFVLILCNYHEVDGSPAIANLVNQLLQKMPSHGILVIESRSTPSLEFASLLARREAIGWGSNMLRINAQEIHELARVQGVTPLSKMEAEQLALAFDGWIAGILLGTRLGDAELMHASTRTGILQGLPSMRVEREKLFAYLVNETFKHQPAVYTFLKESAVLRQMTPVLCDTLLGSSNASEHLERLVREGMFVNCSDDGPQQIYICHPVLRELLCDELHRASPERFAELHRRASEQFEAAHDYENAISHALAADDSHRAAQLIIQAHQQMDSRKYTEIVLRWIDALPAETTESYPQLLLIRASIYLMRNEYMHALPLLDTASALYTTNTLTGLDPTDLPRLQAELIILRSKALFQEGRYQESQCLCQQVLEATPMDEVTQRAEAHACFGICASLLGDLTAGVEHLQKALQLWGRNTIRFQTAEAHSALANTYHLMGNFALAEHHLSRAIICWEQLHDEKGKASNLLRMGINKHHQGAFCEAESLLTEVLTMTRGMPGFEREESYALENLGVVYQDQNHYNQSLECLESGLDLARQLKDNFLLNCCLCDLSMNYLLMGDSATALLLLSEIKLPTMHDEIMSYERAIHDITYGLILHYQHRYDEAYTFFTDLEASLKRVGIKRELLRVKLSLSACQLARQKQTEAIRYLDEISAILEIHDYGQFVLARLNRFPEIYHLVKTLPTLERLRTLLHIETPVRSKMQEIPLLAAQPTISSQSRLKIQAFGEPAVFLDERAVTRWRMARSMELFFYLLDCDRPMRKEQIITALWPEVDEQINQTFHSTIHYLRKALIDSCIVSHSGHYRLDLSVLSDNEIQYDVALFKEEYSQAKQCLASEDDAAAKKALLTMVQLYQGDYVQPFYSDWCTFRRDELRTIYLESRNHLANIAWRQEEFDESAVNWQHMLAIDNCLEEAHYGLMKYYARTGKRGSALRQYQRCVETLQQELSARPGQAIQNLYQRLNGSSEAMKKNASTSPPAEKTRVVGK
ncbi:MAG: BTAD domain-containing putative transcriptional regulator [Ktedonobacteraceae bacterium]